MHKDSNILIIYTGGTIGMQPSEKGFSASKGFEQLLSEHLSEDQHRHLSATTILEFDQPIDSSNATPNDWYKIANCISDNYQNYSAFIVLHGTDTMAYSAAAVHHLLGDNIKPVIFSGSQIPLSQKGSDGQRNLLDAIHFAKQGKLSQVAICFDGKLLEAITATKVHTSELAAFSSPNSKPIEHADNPQPDSKKTQHQQLITNIDLSKHNQAKQTKSNDSVAVLLLHPCISNQVIEATFNNTNTSAVIMLTYGAGNPPDQNAFLMKTLKEASKRGIVIINKTQCFQGSVAQGNYAVGSALNDLGVISAEERTLEDLVTDLYIHSEDYLKQ